MDFVSKIRLIRPVNCLMMGFAVLVGAYLANAKSPSIDHTLTLAKGFLTGFSLTGASMAINDYFDRFIDAVNEPERPIPSGSVKPSEALIYAAFLTMTGFTSAIMNNLQSLFASIAAWILFSAYTVKGKRMGFIGNLMVGGCVATPFIYGSLIVNGFDLSNVVFASLAFLSNTGREITKGIVDVSGDRSHGIKTLAVTKGERAAACVASVFYLSSVGLSLLPWILGLVSFYYLILVCITDLGFIISVVSLLKKPTIINSRRVKQAVLFWMFLALTAFLVG